MFARVKRWARGFKAQLLILWFCRSHPETPLSAKLLAGLVVAYAFSPIDLIPDFIPVLGYLDDLILLPLGIYLILRLIPEHVRASARVQAENWMRTEKSKPINYLGAALVVLLWLAAGYGLWRLMGD